ncbi:hypothetical protein ADIMK_2746 [Marinobacterium lacunae]|uniref:diguanylate cyclase n=2 Tax=Marinobacterium lacunae TaxID=1232683 RepID=A0A081FXG7_9GAMM|nr:hypothetical protein ADIMK_2746 [Marinobacterium lacunae]
MLMGGLAVWLSTPLLDGIVKKARQTSEEQLPQITRWRHNGERAELLHSYINTVFWVEDPLIARQARLQAQVLVHGLALEADEQINRQADDVITKLLALIEIRQQQRQIQQSLNKLAESELELYESLAPSLMLESPFYRQSHAISRFAASTTDTSIHNSDWGHLQQEITSIIDSLSALAADEPLQQTAINQYLSLLQRQSRSLTQMQVLIEQTRQIHVQALAAQQTLSGMLNSDAALKTQQLAERVESDALQVRTYTQILLSIFALLGTVSVICFHVLVLKPILHATRALDSVGLGTPLPPDTCRPLFSELNAIVQSVWRYGEVATELHNTNAELRELSQIDGLTGLKNRRCFDTALQSEYDRSSRHGHSLGLVLFDLDHFKCINDRYGHLLGDDCLKAFADLLKQFSQRSGEMAARYGGEEFALILPEITFESAQNIAEKIRQACTELSIRSEHDEPIELSVSAGLIHVNNTRLYPPEAILREADAALYRAKQQGRNRVESVSSLPGIHLCTRN